MLKQVYDQIKSQLPVYLRVGVQSNAKIAKKREKPRPLRKTWSSFVKKKWIRISGYINDLLLPNPTWRDYEDNITLINIQISERASGRGESL